MLLLQGDGSEGRHWSKGSFKQDLMKITFDNIKARVSIESNESAVPLQKAAMKLRLDAPGAKYMKSHQAYLEINRLTASELNDIKRLLLESATLKEGVSKAALKYRLDPVTLSYISRGQSGWDGTVNLMNNKYEFNTGLLPTVLTLLKAEGIEPYLEDARPLVPLMHFHSTDVQLRDYQQDAINAAMCSQQAGIWWPRGVLQLATGGGKTEVAAAMIQTTNVPTAFFVHRLDLLYQAKERFEKFNLKVGVVGNGKYDVENHHNVIVTTVQTIHSLRRSGSTAKLDFLKNIEQVFFDEGHLLAADVDKGNIFVDTAALLPKAYMRWGLTATPFMRDKFSNWLLEGVTGEVLYEISNKELINRGFLTPPRIIMVKAPKVEKCPNRWSDTKAGMGAYSRGIVLNPGRNNYIVDFARQLAPPCLILVTQTAHGEIIRDGIKNLTGVEPPFLNGDTPVKVRRATVKEVREGKIPVLIASTIFDEGLDLPELRSLILAGGGKSKVKMLQRLGRGLRKDEDKDIITVVDFVDTSCKLLKNHSDERRQVWLDQGFEVEDVK